MNPKPTNILLASQILHMGCHKFIIFRIHPFRHHRLALDLLGKIWPNPAIFPSPHLFKWAWLGRHQGWQKFHPFAVFIEISFYIVIVLQTKFEQIYHLIASIAFTPSSIIPSITLYRLDPRF